MDFVCVQEIGELKMESLGVEEWVDYGCEGCSRHSFSDDTEEGDDQATECDGGDEEGTDWKEICQLTAADLINSKFESDEKAYEAYVRYARSIGFAVQKADVARDDNGTLIRCKFVCNREGLRDRKHYMRIDRKREHKSETRIDCKARLLVYLDKITSTWKMSKLEEAHNHEITSQRFVHLIPNHCGITDAEKAQIDSMHRYGVQTSQIMGFMASQAGGYSHLRFSKKDLYNYIDRERRGKIIDGDAAAAISYLQGKVDAEPMTVARYTCTNEDRLGNLLWADGLSQVDY